MSLIRYGIQRYWHSKVSGICPKCRGPVGDTVVCDGCSNLHAALKRRNRKTPAVCRLRAIAALEAFWQALGEALFQLCCKGVIISREFMLAEAELLAACAWCES